MPLIAGTSSVSGLIVLCSRRYCVTRSHTAGPCGFSCTEASRTYKVAGWASVQDNPQGPAVWDLVTQYLREHKTIKPLTLEVPAIKGVAGNPGLA